jgi:hypothetical protein
MFNAVFRLRIRSYLAFTESGFVSLVFFTEDSKEILKFLFDIRKERKKIYYLKLFDKYFINDRKKPRLDRDWIRPDP